MSVEQLEFILHDDKLRPVYEQYLRAMQAWENLGFITRVEDFTRAQQPEQQRAIAQQIYETFIMPDAEHELGDLDVKSRQAIEAELDNPTPRCFEYLVDYATYTLASSTVEEFLRDTSYLDFVQSQFPRKKDGEEEEPTCLRHSILSCIE